MNRKFLFALWAGLFIVCAAMGFIPEPTGAARVLLTLLSAAFFVPPALLLYQAYQDRDFPVFRLVRNLSAMSLGLTLALLVLNFLSALRSETLGDILYSILTIVSSPMVCSGYWVLSLFLWACLLMVSLKGLRKKK
ncbi:MAG: hypothetical protein ACI4PH_04485 [Faecousia sp.]